MTTFHQNRPRGCAGGRSKRADRATPAAADQVPSAADRGRPHGRELRAVISRRLSSDERGHLGARPRRDRAGRGGDDRGVVDTFVRAIEQPKRKALVSI